ncbi:MAG: glycosyltransferase family 39 protein [Opitutae bacterium]|nr:glycosyltransferase family 39 protein [Opitutae bacterium]
MPDQSQGDRPSWSRDLALLALLFGLLYFFQLGDSALVNPDEGRYGEIPREMLATGDFVLPRLNGVLYFEKPPLLYWTVAGFMKIFGPDELAMRATPALFALGGVLLAYAAGRRLHDRRTGLAAALVLGTSILYFALARILILDMAVSVLMSATLFCFLLGVREAPGWRRRWFFYGLYASAALATLTKGLIGFLVTGAVMFLWLLLFHQWKRLRPLYLPSGVLLFLALAAPWHVLAAQRNGAWAHFYFVREHWERFTTTEHGRYEPFWFFLPVVLGGLFPWMGFLWPAVRAALAGGWARRRDNADAWFLVTWAAFIFLFFSKSQSKLIPYILPVFPPLAVLIGAWLVKVVEADARPRLRAGLWVFSVVAVVLGAGIAYAVLVPGLIRHAAQMHAVRADGLYSAFALIAGAFAAHWFWRRRHAFAVVLTMAASVTVLLLALGHAQDEIARPGTRDLAYTVKADARPGDRVYHYHEFFHDFTFYAERTVGTVGYTSELELAVDPAARASGRFIDDAEFRRQWNGATRLWVVARKDDVKALFADPSFRYYLIEDSRSHYLFSNQP